MKKMLEHDAIRQLKSSEITKFREMVLTEQDHKCAICNGEIDENSGASLDHQHKFQYETNGVDGNGLIRGVLCRSCNVMEGKVWNNSSRYIQPKNVQERIEWLESLIEYYKSGTYPLIHPSEKVKEKTVSKRNYNKLKKLYNGRAKFPDYPKSGKITVKLSQLFEMYDIEPYN